MIVTDRWIFVHVPKAAGSSITQAFGRKSDLPTHTPLFQVEKGERFAFGFVRNPWARMVSLYRFMCQKTWYPRDAFDQQAMRAQGFKSWLMDGHFIMAEETETVPMQRRPQMYWLDGCDYIGRVEDMPHSFHEACRLGGLGERSLPHINRTSGGDWRAEYDNDTAEFVAHWFAPDIERFGYEAP